MKQPYALGMLFINPGYCHRQRLRNPVISIGNITTGGTGKTPLAIFTAKKVAELGFTPVVLSRGYGRPYPGESRIISPGKQMPSIALEIGDEPALMRRHLPEAWFGISKDRFSVGSRIERDGSKMVFILDDGFQHRKLHRDLDIVLIDSSQPLGYNRIFPRGTLREPLSGLRRCNTVVINDARRSESTVDRVLTDIHSLKLQADLFHCEQSIDTLVPLKSWINSDAPEQQGTQIESAFLVAALGNPLRFQMDVLGLGINIAGSRFYKDHYRLRPLDWRACIQAARETGADAIIISEKDAVKISESPDFPIFVSVQKTQVVEEAAFIELLHRCTFERSTML